MEGDFWHFAHSVSVYIYSLWYREVNNADETVDEKNNDERNKKKNTNENTATENGDYGR